MIDTVVLRDSAAIKFFNNEMAFVRINAEEDTILAQEYRISGYPTIVMLGADGKEVDRLIGYIPPVPFVQKFRDYANGIGTLEDLLNRAAAKTDRALFMEIGMKYKYRGGTEDATYWYTRALEEGDALDSLSGECRIALADMHRRAKNYDKALADYAQITADFGDLPAGTDAEIWTAIIYRKTGDTAKAVAQFEAFIENHPNHGDAEYCRQQIVKLTTPAEEDDQSH
ncbi:MAG: tetratricopeptide repeat protein [candidate division Zixibacteria bacterium]|nr:tetratricopeptide repeat protein [candidate division Zixibacteria bacterium]MDH3936302.1 tetratricopeptide repeat protein [candidate division Zixibacteria bacterium]